MNDTEELLEYMKEHADWMWSEQGDGYTASILRKGMEEIERLQHRAGGGRAMTARQLFWAGVGLITLAILLTLGLAAATAVLGIGCLFAASIEAAR